MQHTYNVKSTNNACWGAWVSQLVKHPTGSQNTEIMTELKADALVPLGFVFNLD